MDTLKEQATSYNTLFYKQAYKGPKHTTLFFFCLSFWCHCFVALGTGSRALLMLCRYFITEATLLVLSSTNKEEEMIIIKM